MLWSVLISALIAFFSFHRHEVKWQRFHQKLWGIIMSGTEKENIWVSQGSFARKSQGSAKSSLKLKISTKPQKKFEKVLPQLQFSVKTKEDSNTPSRQIPYRGEGGRRKGLKRSPADWQGSACSTQALVCWWRSPWAPWLRTKEG